MNPMTSHERFTRMFDHREADRVPIIDSPWRGTIQRWQREGMPAGMDWRDYFSVDKVATINVDISPRYPQKVLEDKPDYTIRTSEWGVTMKQFKDADSTPEFLDFTVVDPDTWARAKSRMTVSRDRIDWKSLEQNYGRWRAEGQWIQAGFWFGFDVSHAWMTGTETLLIALIEEPEMVRDMFNHYLDQCIAHFDLIWNAGFTFDSIFWPDDMGYKNTPFFSLAMYRDLLKPVHRRAAAWAHAKGIKAHLHSCGFIMPFVPDLIDAGIDALNPIEIKAGMDVLRLKRDHGDRLVLHGGINAVLWDKKDAIIAEIDQTVPVLKERGGYIFSSDHSIPNSVSLDNFRAIVAEVKKAGAFA
jgi:uroporphyrinogen decarboxylase